MKEQHQHLQNKKTVFHPFIPNPTTHTLLIPE